MLCRRAKQIAAFVACSPAPRAAAPQRRRLVTARLAPRASDQGSSSGDDSDGGSGDGGSGSGGSGGSGGAPPVPAGLEPALAPFAAQIQGRRFTCTQCGKWCGRGAHRSKQPRGALRFAARGAARRAACRLAPPPDAAALLPRRSRRRRVRPSLNPWRSHRSCTGKGDGARGAHLRGAGMRGPARRRAAPPRPRGPSRPPRRPRPLHPQATAACG
jgi:hypothetical protein